MNRRLVACCAAAVGLLACHATKSSPDAGPQDGSIASILLTPGSSDLAIGEQRTANVRVHDAAGDDLPNVTLTWQSADATIATFVDGRITAVAAGETTLTVSGGAVTSAPMTVTVLDLGSDPSSSQDKIAAALTAGTITDEQSLTYRIYARFGDPRLPRAFKGQPAAAFEATELDELEDRFDGLSADAQAALGPYLLRPSDPGSWLNLAGTEAPPSAAVASKAIRASGLTTRPTCVGETEGFTAVSTDESKVKVWYQYGIPGQRDKAQLVLDALEKEGWPALISGGLGLNAPLADTGSCNGGDGRLDVYLVSNMSAYGITNPEGLFNSKQAPTYVVLKGDLGDLDIQGAAIHELFHAIHWSYSTAADQTSYGWMREALANWAVDQVYGTRIQTEQQFADCFMGSPSFRLEDRSSGFCKHAGVEQSSRDYGAYLFFQFIARTASPDTVKGILLSTVGEHGETLSLQAVNDFIDGGFKQQWPEFAKALWNQDPVTASAKSFKSWDALTERPKSNDLGGDLSGLPEVQLPLNSEQENLSSRYYHFTFSETQARSVLFYNGFYDLSNTQKKAIKVRALWQDATGTWQDEDWTPYEYVGLCRDMKSQRAQDLIVIVSNAEFMPEGGGTLTADEEPYLKVSNVGCWRYQGTSTTTYRFPQWTGPGRQISANLSFDLMPGTDAIDYENPLLPSSKRVGGVLLMRPSGSYTFQVSYSFLNCTYSFLPTQFTLGPFSGAVRINPFPELHSTDPLTQSFINLPSRTYNATAGDATIVNEPTTGSGCSGPTVPDAPGPVILTDDVQNDMYVQPPVVLPDGSLNGPPFSKNGTVFVWNLQPQTE